MRGKRHITDINVSCKRRENAEDVYRRQWNMNELQRVIDELQRQRLVSDRVPEEFAPFRSACNTMYYTALIN